MTMDKAALLSRARRTSEVVVEGGVVLVRGLSREECIDVRNLADDDKAMERAILHLGMVDPALTDQEAGRWMATADSPEILRVLRAIQDLSGLSEGAPKSGVLGAAEG